LTRPESTLSIRIIVLATAGLLLMV
jgi:hypothetical protein